MFCTKCGGKIKGGDNFCAKCGQKVERGSVSEQPNEGDEAGKPKSRSLALKIAFGVVVVALLVGGWFGWSAYSSFRDKRRRSSRHEERVNEKELQGQYEQAKLIYECVLKGEGSFERINDAVRLATPAAENGTTDAQVLLGACYEEMYRLEGKSEWIANSAKWYLKAAKSGDQYSQGRIANYYLEGLGVPEDPDEAYKWAHKAGVLIKNANIQLESGRNGIVLTSDELPPSQLTIDVDNHGICMIDGRRVTTEQIQQSVKKRLLKYHNFPCMIRADKRVELCHVWKAMTAYHAGLTEAITIAPDVLRDPSEDRYVIERLEEPGFRLSFVALHEKWRFEEIYSKLNIFVPTPNPDQSETKEENDTSIKILIGQYEEFVAFNGEPMRFDKLDECIKKLASNSTDAQVLLGCTEDSHHGTLIRVLDICHKYNMRNLNFYFGGLPADERLEEEPPPPAEIEPPPEDMDTPEVQIDSPVVSPAATERAVLMALRWLKATQEPDGSWGTKPELGLTKGMDKAAGVGFAALTFLAHGETPASKEFGPTVEKALNYLICNVYVVKDKSGKEVKDPNDPSGNTPLVKMRGAGGSEYGFLIGTYAICEAYAMTKNPNARAAAEKMLARIIWGQTPTGGWNLNLVRETNDGSDDLSFGVWAMLALKSAKMSGIHLEGMDECIQKAITCLKTRNYNKNAGFVCRPGGQGGGLAGAGCLCLQLFGCAEAPEVANALEVMKDWQPTLDEKHMSGGDNAQYCSYFASQCKYQAGMAKNATPANFALWKKWNTEMRNLYPKSIITVMDPKTNQPYTIEDADGNPREIGHWVNGDHYNYDVMGTCLAALQLMVGGYHHILPTTQLEAQKMKEGDIDVSIDI